MNWKPNGFLLAERRENHTLQLIPQWISSGRQCFGEHLKHKWEKKGKLHYSIHGPWLHKKTTNVKKMWYFTFAACLETIQWMMYENTTFPPSWYNGIVFVFWFYFLCICWFSYYLFCFLYTFKFGVHSLVPVRMPVICYQGGRTDTVLLLKWWNTLFQWLSESECNFEFDCH